MKTSRDTTDYIDDDTANRDPITKEPGSHPVGTGVGAGAAGLAGAVVGTALGGPVGGVIAATAGAAVGAAVGHNAAEVVNPTYVAAAPVLRERFVDRPYAVGRNYEEFEDAYIFGTTERQRGTSAWNDEVEVDLRERWQSYPARSHARKLDWEQARPAVRDAWDFE